MKCKWKIDRYDVEYNNFLPNTTKKSQFNSKGGKFKIIFNYFKTSSHGSFVKI